MNQQSQKRQWTAESVVKPTIETKKDITPTKSRYEEYLGFEEEKKPSKAVVTNAVTKPTITNTEPASTQQQNSGSKKPTAFKGPSFNPLMKRSTSSDSKEQQQAAPWSPPSQTT